MIDQFVKRENQGFLSRLASSFMGVLIGILLIPASTVVIAWNEYRTIHRTRGLAEGEKVVVEVADSNSVESKNDGKLVKLTGIVSTNEISSDPIFVLPKKADESKNYLRLRRNVEMFQWVEKKESKSRDKLGGGRETVTTYEYTQKWHANRVASESFENSAGHNNPPLKYPAQNWTAEKAQLGAFALPSSMVERIDSWSPLVPDAKTMVSKLPEADQAKFLVDGISLYFSDTGIPDPKNPKVGDLRITFEVVDSTEVSVLCKQNGNQLASFKTSNGESIESLSIGKKSAQEMFQGLKMENSIFAYLLRAAGWLMACIGFTMLAGPLHALANVVPLFGKMVGAATMFIGFLLGSMLALVTIGIAWIAVRPLYGITLLALASVGVYFLMRRKGSTEPPIDVPI